MKITLSKEEKKVEEEEKVSEEEKPADTSKINSMTDIFG